MIQSAVGVRCKPANQTWSNVMQRWLEAHGLYVYTPHRMNGESANLSVEYDPLTTGLKWSNTTLNHLSLLPLGSMLMDYGAYHRGQFGEDTWRTVNFPDHTDPNRRWTQDDLTAKQLSIYFQNIMAYLARKNIRGYMFMDEPPHESSNPAKPDEYGWSPDTEKRDIKWATACVLAEMPIRIAMPGPSQLKYWLARMPKGVSWVLQEKNDPATYAALLPAGTEIWIYNVRATMVPKLGKRLDAFAAAGLPVTGVLMWNAVPWTHDNEMPLLFDLSGTTPVPTDAAWMLAQQLTRYNGPMLSTEERLTSLERRTTALEAALGAALKAQTGA